jgi:orotidine-5'-phosphate decarboxylase
MLDKKIIIALDYDSVAEVDSLCNQINPVQCRLKIGKQLFTRYGGNIVKNLQHRDFEIFLDLKFHDIPTTVYKACRAAFDLGVWMLNIHIQGGEKMIEAAIKARDESNPSSKLIGVTALTSLNKDDLSIYNFNDRSSLVNHLALRAHGCGMDGVVCSPGDIAKIEISDDNFQYVTPGIRLTQNQDDHEKAFTPQDAVKLGSNYLVLGRAVTESDNPEATIKSVIESID